MFAQASRTRGAPPEFSPHSTGIIPPVMLRRSRPFGSRLVLAHIGPLSASGAHIVGAAPTTASMEP